MKNILKRVFIMTPIIILYILFLATLILPFLSWVFLGSIFAEKFVDFTMDYDKN